MKALYLKSLVAAALAVTLSSCEKKAENIENLSQLKMQVSGIVYPIEGVDQSTNILPKRKLPRAVLTKGYGIYKSIKAKLIDTVCEEYINSTSALDISNLKEGINIKKFGNKEFGITTNGEGGSFSFAKLKAGPKGWWTHWNYSPYTASAYPDVLYAQTSGGYATSNISLYLDKPVTSFGFEIAPNTVGEDVQIVAEYKEDHSYRFPDIFTVDQTISSPSGARLIAVKSSIPFRLVIVRVNYNPEIKTTGLAITNIRYTLAK